jgi:hypothetical protein
MTTTSLTAKQAEAVRLYTTPGIYIDNDKSKQTYKNQTQSAIGAGYVAKYANHNINRIFSGNALLAVKEREERLAVKADVTVDEIVIELRKLGFNSDPTLMVNNGDKLRSLELLGRYKAMFKEVAININADIPSDPALRLAWCKDEITRIESHQGIIQAYDDTDTAIASRF